MFILTLSLITAALAILRAVYQHLEVSRLSKLHACQAPRLENPYDLLGINKIIASAQQYFNKTVSDTSIKLFEKNGNTYASRILTEQVIFTCDPRNIKHILALRFEDYDAGKIRAPIFRPLIEHGSLILDGPEWKAMRSIYRTQFSNTRAITDLEMMERHFTKFLGCVSPSRAIDLQALILDLMVDINLEFAMGETVDYSSPSQVEEKKAFTKAVIASLTRITGDGHLGPVSMSRSKKDHYRNCGIVHRYVEKAIDQALEKRSMLNQNESKDEKQHYNFLDSVITKISTKLELRDAVLTITMAGTESVASILSSLFFLLARDEGVFKKLRATILDAIGFEPPTYDELKSLVYLRHALNEAMRLFPPVPINARTANKVTTLPTGGGPDHNSPILVQKDQKIVFITWATHRRTDIFGPDALEFRPERWENLGPESLAGYLPFLSGPRTCPGQQYALMKASFVVVRILQHFKSIRSCDESPWTEHFGLNLSNENGVLVELIRSQDQETKVGGKT